MLKFAGILFPLRSCMHMTLMKSLSALYLALMLPTVGVAQLNDFGIGEGGAPKKVVKVTATVVSEVKMFAPGQAFRAAVKLVHAPDHHTYGQVLPPEIVGKPTTLKWTLPEGWTLEELPWPATHQMLSTGGKMSEGYDGTVYLPVKITPSGSPGEISVKVDALVCDPSSCMPFKATATLTIPLAPGPVIDPAMAYVFKAVQATKPAAKIEPKAAEHSFAVYLIFAFIGGLILNIMPCVFPVLGIKVMGVVQQAGEDKRQVLLHGLAYTVGILITFWALGALVISLGKGWGFQLQSPTFVFGLCAFFLIFALNMAGVFEIGSSVMGVGAELQSKQGLGGSFFSGLLATIVATPCSAPFLGSALGFAVTLPAASAMLMFTMIGLGLASPFLLLAFAPKLISALPRPGAWMESFKQGMSFLLFGTVAFLTWVLTGMVEGQPLLFLLFGLVVISLGCWIYGRWALPHKSARTRTVAYGLTLVAIVGGLALGWPNADARADQSSVTTEGSLVWEVWSPEKVAELRAAKTPVYIDFTAKWCLTCQVNKRIYKDAGLQALFGKKKVVLLKADWTNENEAIKQALTDLGKAAVPVNVLYLPGKDEPFVFPELLSVENVSAALNQLAD